MDYLKTQYLKDFPGPFNELEKAPSILTLAPLRSLKPDLIIKLFHSPVISPLFSVTFSYAIVCLSIFSSTFPDGAHRRGWCRISKVERIEKLRIERIFQINTVEWQCEMSKRMRITEMKGVNRFACLSSSKMDVRFRRKRGHVTG